jgi:hypothetical protein
MHNCAVAGLREKMELAVNISNFLVSSWASRMEERYSLAVRILKNNVARGRTGDPTVSKAVGSAEDPGTMDAAVRLNKV